MFHAGLPLLIQPGIASIIGGNFFAAWCAVSRFGGLRGTQPPHGDGLLRAARVRRQQLKLPDVDGVRLPARPHRLVPQLVGKHMPPRVLITVPFEAADMAAGVGQAVVLFHELRQIRVLLGIRPAGRTGDTSTAALAAHDGLGRFCFRATARPFLADMAMGSFQTWVGPGRGRERNQNRRQARTAWPAGFEPSRPSQGCVMLPPLRRPGQRPRDFPGRHHNTFMGGTIPNFDEPRVATHGRTLRQILDEVIDRRRLLGYTVDVKAPTELVPDETITIKAFTFAPDAITFEDHTIGANAEQVSIEFDDDTGVQAAILRRATLESVDQVICQGSRAVGCFTLVADGGLPEPSGTLVPNWTVAQQTEYDSGASTLPAYVSLPPSEIAHRQQLDEGAPCRRSLEARVLLLRPVGQLGWSDWRTADRLSVLSAVGRRSGQSPLLSPAEPAVSESSVAQDRPRLQRLEHRGRH